uniref:cellular tumor antigen p53-like n=1 Tax=Maylandia zebra TaxID=106582 RepID=UPI000D31F02A|nr:cellular tumor antigen p53-like [Maylandia zebra]
MTGTGTTERQPHTSKLHRAHAAPRRINDVPGPRPKPSHPLPPRRLLLGPSRTTHQPLLQEDNKQKKESGTKEAKKRKSAPPPDTTSTKKSKCTSSAEGDDKEVFLLPVRGRERYEMLKKINDCLELLDKDSKSKSKVSVKHEVPVPSSGKRLLQRGERSDSD